MLAANRWAVWLEGMVLEPCLLLAGRPVSSCTLVLAFARVLAELLRLSNRRMILTASWRAGFSSPELFVSGSPGSWWPEQGGGAAEVSLLLGQPAVLELCPWDSQMCCAAGGGDATGGAQGGCAGALAPWAVTARPRPWRARARRQREIFEPENKMLERSGSSALQYRGST